MFRSGSDHDESGGGGIGLLSRSRFAHSGNRLLNKKRVTEIFSSAARRRVVKPNQLIAPAGGDLISSILNSQTLWHSKKTEIKSNSDGSLLVKLPGEGKRNEKPVDVSKNKEKLTTVPLYPGAGTNQGCNYQPTNNRSGGQHSTNTETNLHTSYGDSNFSSFASTLNDFPRFPSNVNLTPFRGNAPIRFRMTAPPRRPNIHTFPSNNDSLLTGNRQMPSTADLRLPSSNSPQRSPTPDEEIDIYSDIEQENHSQEGNDRTYGVLEPPPEPPAMLMGLGINDDAPSDEDNGLVIDDPPAPPDMYDPEDHSDNSETSVNKHESTNKGK